MKWNKWRRFVRAAASRQRAPNITRHTSYLLPEWFFERIWYFFFWFHCIVWAFSRWDVITFLHTVLSESAINWNCIIYFLKGLDASTPWVWLPASRMSVNNLHEPMGIALDQCVINASGWTIWDFRVLRFEWKTRGWDGGLNWSIIVYYLL